MKTKIKILKSVAGKYNLPYYVGEIVQMEKKQANELIKFGYAEEVKSKPKK